jgi:hypothetical protein
MESAFVLRLPLSIASAFENLLLYVDTSVTRPPQDSSNLHVIKRILNGKMQSTNTDVSPRSYLTKLSMAPQSDAPGPIYDDITIAEGLLNNSKVPHRSSSFTGIQGFTRSNGKFGSSAALTEASTADISRRAVRTSNTWTSSSGDIVSDQDEIEDRTLFVQEFNRLAKKVCIIALERYGCC